MSRTFLVYDLETSGLQLGFDQVMQYAAMRISAQGECLSEATFHVALSPDVLPDPHAMIVHRQGIETCQKGYAQDEAVRTIHAAFNQPGTFSGGYNTLGFDDEFMRFSFDRYLLPPYTHQYANQCGRFDAYPIAVLYHLFQSEVLDWPSIDGRTSLKLEHLNQANGWVKDAQAHDAMADVQVTVALMQALKQCPQMWDYALGYFHKATDLDRQSQLPTQFEDYVGRRPLALAVEGRFGVAARYQAPLLGLGGHRHYTNQSVWLRLDRLDLSALAADELGQNGVIVKKKTTEPPFLLPLIERFTKHWDAERWSLVRHNLRWLASHDDEVSRWASRYTDETYPDVSCDADAALYAGFRSRQAHGWAERFWLSAWPQRAQQVLGWQGRIQAQGARIIWRHAAEHLSEAHQNLLADFFEDMALGRGQNHRGQMRRSPDDVCEAIEALRATDLDAQQQQLLSELETYAQAKKLTQV